MIKKKLFGDTLKAQLVASARDRIYKFMLAGGEVRGAVVNGTRMVNEMRANHDLGILESLVLGRTYLGGVLMAANLKGQDRLAIQIECSGAVKGLLVEANAFGEVRGYLKNVPIPVERPLESFDLSSFFGAGFLTVTRYLEDAKQPFAGKVMLKYGNIALDLANYYLQSEQIPTAFNLSIKFNPRGEINGAGGLFLQAMPGVADEITRDMENRVTDFPSLGDEFAKEINPEEIIRDVFRDYAPEFLADYRVEFMCHCNQQKTRRMLALLPIKELKDILETGPFPLEVRCHHCNTFYDFDKNDIQEIYGLRYPNN